MLFVLSVGGSLVHPSDGLDIKFINSFGKFLDQQTKLGHRFLLVAGGGEIARDYIETAKELKINRDDQDNLGIGATRQNALLLKSYLKKITYPEIIKDPNIKVNFKDKIAIAGGFKPGRSTDYVAVSLALTYGSNMVINLSNIDYVYNKDPRVKGAKKIKNITWSEFRKIVGNKWRPGIISPFDPVAAKLAQKNNLLVVVLNGKKLKNISNCLNKQRFTGTSIN
jgi:uridylate kinase